MVPGIILMHEDPAAHARRQAWRFPAPWSWLALALLAFFLAVSTRPALAGAWDRAALALRTARVAGGESTVASRQRCLGARYVAGVELIRRALPADEPFLLVEGGNPLHGGALWVRYELAPRRAVFFGRLGDFSRASPAGAARLRRRIRGRLRWVVVAYEQGSPPVLLPRYQFMQRVAGRPPGAG